MSLYLKADMMHAFAALGQVAADAGIGVDRLQELDVPSAPPLSPAGRKPIRTSCSGTTFTSVSCIPRASR